MADTINRHTPAVPPLHAPNGSGRFRIPALFPVLRRFDSIRILRAEGCGPPGGANAQ